MFRKKTIIILCLSIFFLTNIEVQAENVKGDLRCPQNLSNNVSCIPTQFGSDGKPQKVELTWNQSVSNSEWIKVKKIVSKTDTVFFQFIFKFLICFISFSPFKKKKPFNKVLQVV